MDDHIPTAVDSDNTIKHDDDDDNSSNQPTQDTMSVVVSPPPAGLFASPPLAASASLATANASSSAAASSKRYRPAPAKTFQCRGYGECRMVFSRSEHLARHIRYAYIPTLFITRSIVPQGYICPLAVAALVVLVVDAASAAIVGAISDEKKMVAPTQRLSFPWWCPMSLFGRRCMRSAHCRSLALFLENTLASGRLPATAASSFRGSTTSVSMRRLSTPISRTKTIA